MMRTYAEDRVQAAIVEFVRAVAPQVRIYAVPNGGLRSKSEAAKLKWTGVLPGVPDLEIAMSGGRHAYIEVKSPVGGLRPEQIEWRDWCASNGTPWALCRSIDDARRFLADMKIETREAVAA